MQTTLEPRWAGWTLLLVLAQMLCVALWTPTLSDPDEAMFGCVARTMLQTGDWIVPKDRGKAFLDRPILHYWLMAGAMKVCGPTDWACRLPSLLCGALTTLLLGRLALALDGSRSASMWLFVTTPAGLLASIAVGHDISLLTCITAATWAGVIGSRSTSVRRQVGWTLLAGGCMGLGVLAKGLLGIVLPILAWCWLVDRPLRHVIPGLLAVLLALLVASSWYLPMESRVPGYWRYFLIERHLGGYMTNAQRHGEASAWIYVPTLLLGGLPWLLPTFSSRSFWQACWRDQTQRRLLGWLASVVVFFMAAGSRNPFYLLPAFIPLMLLLAPTVTMTSSRWLARWSMSWCYVMLLTAKFVVPVFMPWRCASSVADALQSVPAAAEVAWYFHIPPSAQWLAPDRTWRRINGDDLQTEDPPWPAIVVRQSRLDDVQNSPIASKGEWRPIAGKYRLWERSEDSHRAWRETSPAR